MRSRARRFAASRRRPGSRASRYSMRERSAGMTDSSPTAGASSTSWPWAMTSGKRGHALMPRSTGSIGRRASAAAISAGARSLGGSPLLRGECALAEFSDEANQYFRIEGLRERRGRPQPSRDLEEIGVADPTTTGNCDDRQLRVLLADIDDGLDALFFGHDDIGHNQVGPGALEGSESLFPVRGLDHLDPGILEQQRDGLAHRQIVIDDQHLHNRTPVAPVTLSPIP